MCRSCRYGFCCQLCKIADMPRKQGRSTPAPQASWLISAGLLIKAAEGLRQLKRRPTEEAAHNKSMPGKKTKVF